MGDKANNSKLIALTTQRRMKDTGLVYNGVRTKDIVGKSKRLEADQGKDDNYSKFSGFNTIGNIDMSVISKDGEYKNLKMLGAYFSEKDLKPRFTESVLKKQKDSRYKFSDDEDDLLEAINNPTMRTSNAKTLKRDHQEQQKRKTNTQSTPDLIANHKISIEKPVNNFNANTEEQIIANRDEKLTQLLHD